jgi:hypothetical protein
VTCRGESPSRASDIKLSEAASVAGLGWRSKRSCTPQGQVGPSVFFFLPPVLCCVCVCVCDVSSSNCEFACITSSRFDSWVSILVASFLRPDGWIQRSNPTLDTRPTDQDPILYRTVIGAVRHGSSCELYSSSGAYYRIGEWQREWQGSLVYGRSWSTKQVSSDWAVRGGRGQVTGWSWAGPGL